MAKHPNRYISDEGKEVWKELEKIHHFGYPYSTIFTDWVDLALNSLLSLTANMGKPDLVERLKNNSFDDPYNARYMEVIRRYKENAQRPRGERPADYFTNAWALLMKETKDKQQDILGQIFMEWVSFGEAGQFFTPHHVTDMMAKMVVGTPSDGERILDPCCGSGRMLLSVSKENPNCVFYGNDIDLRCAKMAALNMWLFDLDARVTCGDGLTGRWHVGWRTRKGGYIWEIQPKDDKPEPEPITIETSQAASVETQDDNAASKQKSEKQLPLNL